MLFEQVRAGGCLSYLIGCEATHGGMLVDPHLDQSDHYVALDGGFDAWVKAGHETVG